METELKSVAAVSLSSRNCRFILRDEDKEEAEAELRKALDMWTAFMRKRRLPEECVRNPYLKGKHCFVQCLSDTRSMVYKRWLIRDIVIFPEGLGDRH